MKYRHILAGMAVGAMMLSCGKKESTLELSYPEFDGEKIELISFNDSTILQTGMLTQGKAKFDNSELLSESGPQLAQIVIDGRVKGFLVIEEGNLVLTDTMSVAKGSPMNDLFAREISRLDSVENLNDMIAYAKFAQQKYNENKGNVLGDYFGVEWLKYGEPKEVLAMLEQAPAKFRESKRVQRFARYAQLRGKTAVGEKFADFETTLPDGKREKLSDFVKPGVYTLVDFWASWCPYCIKEMPEVKALSEKYAGKLQVAGVAVRDEVADTDKAIAKHGITWPVMKNAAKIPYDVYGFSGIPYLILIGPDGTIIARGESAAQTADRLAKLIK
ncbi:MAG: redoxin domain-containing protein [Muribaculaceae bacterium]|nr:redoxin domain-containing protein [Muribaculaceae bacterium]